MRRLFIIGAALLTLSVACNDNKDEVEDTGVIEEVVLDSDSTNEVQPNPSDVSFITALEEYQEGNYKQAADYIENGIINLREEEKSTEKVNGIIFHRYVVSFVSNVKKIR